MQLKNKSTVVIVVSHFCKRFFDVTYIIKTPQKVIHTVILSQIKRKPI